MMYNRENLKFMLQDVEDAFRVLANTRTYINNYELQRTIAELLFTFRDNAKNDVVYYIWDKVDSGELIVDDNKSYVKKLNEFARCIGVYSTYLYNILKEETKETEDISDKQFNNYIKEESKKYHELLLSDMRKDIKEIRVYNPVPDDYQENNYIITTEIRFKHSGLVIKIDSETETERDLTDDRNKVYIDDIMNICVDNVKQDLDSILGMYYDEYKKNSIYTIMSANIR